MFAFLAPLLLKLSPIGDMLKAFFKWLSNDAWKITTLLSCIYIVITHFELISARHEAAKWHTQYTSVQTQLQKLSVQSKAQQKAVTQTVNHYLTVDRPVVEKEVQRIEQSPAVPGCKTPPAILGADL